MGALAKRGDPVALARDAHYLAGELIKRCVQLDRLNPQLDWSQTALLAGRVRAYARRQLERADSRP
jgi:hypothetical protein